MENELSIHYISKLCVSKMQIPGWKSNKIILHQARFVIPRRISVDEILTMHTVGRNKGKRKLIAIGYPDA